MEFFRFFPTTAYQFQTNTSTYALTVTNMTVHVKLAERLKQSISVFYDYQIEDGQRPDTVSVNLYGVPDYTWVILLVNNIFSLFDWPLTNDEFDRVMAERYGSLTNAKSTFVYKTSDGFFVDLTTWTALNPSLRQDPISNYDNELDLNEAKRRIKVVPAPFILPLVNELKSILAS